MTQAYYTASNFFASQSLNTFIQTVSKLSKGLVIHICKVSKILLMLEILITVDICHSIFYSGSL